MKDFVRPNGRYVGMYPEMKIAFFTDVVKIINARKDYSISVDVPLSIYNRLFPRHFQREILSPHAVAFIGVSQYNVKVAKDNNYPDRMDYVVDKGNPFSDQLLLGHRIQSYMEKPAGSSFTGDLAFKDDLDSAALQVADVVAWSVHRKSADDALWDEYTPYWACLRGASTAAERRSARIIHIQLRRNLSRC